MATGGGINIGGIYADLDLNTGNLERGLANARRATDAYQTELHRLQQQQAAGAIGAAEYAARVAAINHEIANLSTHTQAAYAALGVTGHGLDIFNHQMQVGQNRAGAFGRGLMQLGYVADDIQYSFGSIVNNIAPLTQSFAQAAGATAANANMIAAGVQVAAVATYQLYTHWDQLIEVMGGSVVRTEAEEMERLAKATQKTVEETGRLLRYKQEQAGKKRMETTRPDAEEKVAKTVEKAVTESDTSKVATGISGTLQANGRGIQLTQAEKDKIGAQVANERDWADAGRMFGGVGMSTEEAKALYQKRLQEETDRQEYDRAIKLVVQAKTDPHALRALTSIVDSNPGAFAPGFLKDLQDQLPENREQQTKWEAEGAANAARMEEGIKKDKDKKKSGKDLDDFYAKDAKEVEANRKKAESESDQRDREFRESNREVAGMVSPGIEDYARRQTRRDRLNKTSDAKANVKKALVDAGMSEDDAGLAARDFTADAKAKQSRLSDDELREQGDHEARQQRAENRRRANDKLRGLDASAQNRTIGAMLSGMPMTHIGEQLAKTLESMGFNKEAAAGVAGDVFRDARKKVNQTIFAASEKDREEMLHAHSTVMGTTDLTRTIQGGISQANEMSRQTGLQGRIAAALDEMARRNVVTFEVEN